MKSTKHIGIAGAGLVGSLLSIYLRKRGYEVSVFERRGDMRTGVADAGRSINLALSNRGLKALKEVDLADKMSSVIIPLHGRMMHDIKGELTFLPYGTEGQFINSTSRNGLNIVLVDEAERLGVKFFFGKRIQSVDLEQTTIHVDNDAHTFDVIIGADGAFSAVRGAMQVTDRFNYKQNYIQHGYKELTIPPSKDKAFQLDQNSLHIWPRESYMLIALPNPDGSFTCTLFFPFEGDLSFRSLEDDDSIRKFFQEKFPDAAALIPDLLTDFHQHPSASLVTIQCFPWVKNNCLVIGDAAHAIVPFYGQGMNAGFEDCRVLNDLLNKHHDDWDKTFVEFQQLRKPDADSIAQLALDNFTEMRDLVGDKHFLLRKKIEAKLHQLFPDRWIPLYSMVTFHEDVRYSEALRIGNKQREIMDEVMLTPDIEATWERLNFQKIVEKLYS